jgi:hypothetical protein
MTSNVLGVQGDASIILPYISRVLGHDSKYKFSLYQYLTIHAIRIINHVSRVLGVLVYTWKIVYAIIQGAS